MHILALLDRGAGVVARIHDLACEAFFHGFLTALAGVVNQPAESQGLAAGGSDFDRHLVGGAADTAGLDLKCGHDVVHGFVERIKGLLAGLFLDDLESVVNDLLSNTFLAVEHNTVDQLGDKNAVVHRIRQDLSFRNVSSSGHVASLLH